MATKPRDFRKEYDSFHGKPEQIKNRAKRVKARRMLEKEGVVRKGDGKDIDHVRPLSQGGGTARNNLRVTSKAKNRGFARTSTGAVKARGK
jgi:5-methylcytosine-specific restriction endonuclease McrA